MTLLGASVVGRLHLSREANAQDAFALVQPDAAPTIGVGVVCDGCGAEPRSEVGAALVARCVANAAARRLATGEPASAIARAIGAEALEALGIIAQAAARGGDVDAFVRQHLLTTLIVLVDDGTTLAVSAWGDGVIALDDDVVAIDEDGAPHYLAYALLDRRGAPPPSFACALPSRSVERAAIATDGLAPELVRGCFGHRGRGLQRWLNVKARAAAFDDDATVIVRELGEARAS